MSRSLYTSEQLGMVLSGTSINSVERKVADALLASFEQPEGEQSHAQEIAALHIRNFEAKFRKFT